MPTMSDRILSDEQVHDFHRDGVLVLPDFYALSDDILPVQKDIYDVIGLVIERHGLDIERPEFSAGNFDAGFMEMISGDRKLGGEVYDAIKQIPAFVRMVVNKRHDALFRQLRDNALPGVAGGGYGIRIDVPFEDRFRANWHQEYPAQLRSMDGLVFWSPLVEITESLGPVEFCLGSHRDGPRPVLTSDPQQPDREGAYSLILDDEDSLLSRYDHIAPVSKPGDLVIIDFLLLHASGHNRSERPRWTMQFRYFNFNDPAGKRHGWQGSFAAGVDFRSVHPELCADQKPAQQS
jgi:hypothetical protein